MEPATVDLETLDLRSGQATRIDLELDPADPVVGGEAQPIEPRPVPAQVEVSRTTSGFALRLLADVAVTGRCARCLEPARAELDIAAREVDQPGTGDAELASPYVEDGILDVGSWLRDAITLGLPEQIVCAPDCAGICQECGLRLDRETAKTHRHERPPDPRFAKLRELLDDD